MTNSKVNILKYLLLAASIVLLTANAMAQSVQKGIILEYNGKDAKTPVANVEIVVNNAGSTVSNSKGEFTLTFRTLKPGDKIAIRRIEKLGYEVFNKEALEQWFISRDNVPFVIVLCRSDRFKKIRDNYSNVAKNSYTVKFENEQIQLKKALDNGAIPGNAYQEKLKALQDQYETQLDNIETYIDKFARIDLSELEDFEKEVINLVAKGEIDEAIKRYDDENLLQKYISQTEGYYKLDDAQKKVSAALDKSVERRDSILRVIRHQVDLLRMAGGKENFDKAMNMMRQVALSDTTNFGTVFEYATYCRKINRIQEALEFYQISLRNVGDKSLEAAQARLGISQAFLRQRDYNEVASAVSPIISILEDLAEKSGNPNLYIEDRISAKSTLARACTQLHDTINAIKYYNEAIADAETLVSMDSTRIDLLAETENMACIMYFNAFHMADESIEMGKRTVEHTEILYKTNPQLYKARYAFAQNTLAGAYELNNDLKQAEVHFLEAERLYTEAYKSNPEAYISYLATNKQALSELYTQLSESETGGEKDIEKALVSLREAESLYNTMVNTYGRTNTTLNMISVHNSYCHLYHITKQDDKGMYYGELALKEIEPYIKKYPATYRELYVDIFCNLHNCYERLNKHTEALEIIDKLYNLTKDEEYINYKKEYLEKYNIK